MQDLSRFVVYEGVEFTPDYIMEENLNIIYEGAALDLYKILRDVRSYHTKQMKQFYKKVNDGDIKGARADLKTILKNLEKSREEVKKIDDTAFTSRIGLACIKIFDILASNTANILSSFATGMAIGVVVDKIMKRNDTLTKNGIKDKAVGAVIGGTLPDAAKSIMNGIKMSKQRQEEIQTEIDKGTSKEEANKKIGGLYKRCLIEYINRLMMELKKIYLNLDFV